MSLRKSIKWIVLIVVAVLGVLIVVHRDWIEDWWTGMGYEASSEMAEIRDKLYLTERGEFLFNASRPALNDSDEFNAYCRSDLDMEMAVLGCYTDGNIYVYNITEDELSGIRELTTAHELLHAVWARMSEAKRRELVPSLTLAFESNQEMLGEEIDTYDESQKQEELYVRAGTEVKDLPVDLERHYAEIFRNQDLVVEYYDSYISVFRKMKAEMDGLKAEMGGIQEQIDTLSAEYENRLVQLNGRITSFNACADTPGCFGNEGEFYLQRNDLLKAQEDLNRMYDEISRLVEEYNVRVKRYNEDVAYSNKLNNIVNSNAKPEKVE